ncbi:aldehyde ferredoxin oxidoreductase family protein [Desulfosarcina sp.]|uniref:aldehyde ferredoxin oxidoreductase family protein n=1 Tax=Desulfosarcina sp. TaxID=2027861 RepID=UPI0029B9D9AD|nr:aldehyde ferredoxin oxidoreductase family protein [Desulfosarcina sp.]MDX2451611.1 aldehyde ferredoxin oxidoreductase family protein [Desulfosarcina sp.]MDX2489400.1 aldehyde ferredoxin oxidoreductase family protein [Desulfosarcina sp.]
MRDRLQSVICGDILKADLNDHTITRETIPDSLVGRFLGGRGFNVGYLFEHLPRGTDPMGPDNILVISCGLLTGSRAPTASRLHLNALSPLTGLIGSSNVGGYAGAWLRSTGILSLVIRGRSSTPVYLYISERNVEIREASPYWGLDAIDTQDRIAGDLAQGNLKILSIGTAGESGVRFACIVAGKDHAAGRTGLGAVMGAKRLKAVVIDKGRCKPFDDRRQLIGSVVKQYVRQIKASPDCEIFSRYGGAGYIKWADDLGVMGTRNYRQNRFEMVDQVDGCKLIEDKVRSSGCYRCPVQCKADLKFKEGPLKGQVATRPEFEPMINLGSKCGLGDLQAVVRLDNLCTRLGMDSTSAATAIAFAMDLFDRGILTGADTDGMALAWGDAAAMEALIRQMAARKGLGGILAQGVKRAAVIIGKDSWKYAAHVKGLELTAYHPAAMLGSALGYAVSSRGGDYNNIYASLEHRWPAEKGADVFGSADSVNRRKPAGKGRLVRRAVLVNIIVDSLGLCKVPTLSLLGAFDLENEAVLASAITGLPLYADDLFHIGDRIAALERLFNLKHAPDMDEDRLPEMFFLNGDTVLTQTVMTQMLLEFYAAMGWDEKGCPLKETLAALGIEPGDPASSTF